MNKYEMILLFKPDITDADYEDMKNKVVTRITDGGGQEILFQNWGKRKLAYEIRDNMKGVYAYFRFLAGGTQVQGLERYLKIQEPVLRFITVKLDELVDVEGFDFDDDRSGIYPFAVKKPTIQKDDSFGSRDSDDDSDDDDDIVPDKDIDSMSDDDNN